jgi:hypothetical protein
MGAQENKRTAPAAYAAFSNGEAESAMANIEASQTGRQQHLGRRHPAAALSSAVDGSAAHHRQPDDSRHDHRHVGDAAELLDHHDRPRERPDRHDIA